ncbi:MAG: hypothetical protein VKI42_04625 [Synechococcaceae cyanobacterium]|nr:hypothetical protein [Synechococcaceae cyanobacterium]
MHHLEEASTALVKVHHPGVDTLNLVDGCGVALLAQPIHREGDAELKTEAADSLQASLACCA